MATTIFPKIRRKILQKILQRLLAQELVTGYKLLSNGECVLEAGSFGVNQVERPFAEFVIHIFGKAGFDTPALERTIKSLRKLSDAMLRGIDENLHMRLGFLLDAYLEILLILEERIHLLGFYEKLLHLNKSILMADDLFGVLQSIMDMACRACNGEAASLLLVDQQTGEMYFNVVSGDNKKELKEIRIPAGRGIAGSVVESARPEIIRDAKSDPRAFQRVDKVLGHETRDMIIAPILAHGRVIGVLEVINSKRSPGFLSEDLDFLINISNHTSLFIENIKAKEDLIRTNYDLDRKHSELQTLHEIGQILNSSLEPTALKQRLLSTLLRSLPIEEAFILEPDGGAYIESLHCRAAEEATHTLSDKVRLTGLTDILLWLKNYREPYSFYDESGLAKGPARRFIEANPEYFSHRPKPDIWVPIFDEKENILFIISLSGTQFRRQMPVSDLKFFQSVMNVCKSAFRNVRSYNAALASRKREEHLRRAFQKYVPTRVVSDLLEDEDPRPSQQTVSVLFADIRNFTHLSETMEPYQLVSLLNRHFEDMVGAVNLHGGIVDKFMGDSLMAVFGVPEASPNDAKNALFAAMEMKKRLHSSAIQREAAGEVVFEMGIGLHTGPVIAGNIGSHTRVDYTIVGETVNLASRLEKAVKHYGIEMLFTEDTLSGSPDFPCREVDLMQVRGSQSPIRVFEPLLNVPGQKGPDFLPHWKEALSIYRTGDFQKAKEIFENIWKDSQEEDTVAGVYMRRSEAFLQNPPPENWQGIFQMDT